MSAKKTIVFGIVLAVIAVCASVYITARMVYLDQRRQAEIKQAEQNQHTEELLEESRKMIEKLRQK